MTEEIRRALSTHGKRRLAARTKAKKESDALRALIPQALEAGMSKSEIARLAQITRPALDTMLKD